MRHLAFFGFAAFLAGCGIESDLLGDPPDALAVNTPIAANPVQEDRIVQVQQPRVDVLFIVDNSCSMSEEQAALSDNFPDFMDYFVGSGLDYHIGVISTDMSDTANHAGKLQVAGGLSFIDENTPNPANIFAQMASLGTNGDFEEKGRAAAYTMVEIKRDIPRNEGFYRDDAALHLVFISDEEDQSGANPVSRLEFREWMENLKWSPEMVTAHGVFFIPNTSCPAGDTPGAEYQAYTDWTDGVAFSLCEPNWAPLLEELGLQTSGLKREYFLSKIPVTTPWSIDVKVVVVNEEGAEVTLGFPSCLSGDEVTDATCRAAYSPGRNSVTFLDYVPDPLSQVLVTYNIRENFAAGVEEDVVNP